MQSIGKLGGFFGEAILTDALLDPNKELCFLECIVRKSEKKALIELLTCLALEERIVIPPDRLSIGVNRNVEVSFFGCYSVILKAKTQYRVIEQSVGKDFSYLTFFRSDISDKKEVVFAESNSRSEIVEELIKWVKSIELPIPNDSMALIVAEHILDSSLCSVVSSFSGEKYGVFIKSSVFSNDFSTIREIVQKKYSCA